MLPLVRAKWTKEIGLIDEAAINYYKGKDRKEERAEYIYHSLLRGDNPQDLEPLLTPDLELYLGNSIEELSDDAQLFLTSYFEYPIQKNLLNKLSLKEWEKNMAKKIESVLEVGKEEDFLNLKKDLKSKKERSKEGVLLLEEARFLERLSELEESYKIINVTLKSFEFAPNLERVFETLLLKSQVEERLGLFGDAINSLDRLIFDYFLGGVNPVFMLKDQLRLFARESKSGKENLNREVFFRNFKSCISDKRFEIGKYPQNEFEIIKLYFRAHHIFGEIPYLKKLVDEFVPIQEAVPIIPPYLIREDFDKKLKELRKSFKSVRELEIFFRDEIGHPLRKISPPGVLSARLFDVAIYVEDQGNFSLFSKKKSSRLKKTRKFKKR